MTAMPQDLAERRRVLVARAAEQRAALVTSADRLAAPLQRVDHGMRTLASLRQHPALIVGVVVAIVLIKPRRIGALIEVGRKAFRAWAVVAPVVARRQR